MSETNTKIYKTSISQRNAAAKYRTNNLELCRERGRIKQREYVKNNPDKVKISMAKSYSKNPEYYKNKARENTLKRKYNITPKIYDSLLEKQNFHCAICPATQNIKAGKSIRFCVDHNHITGEVRGLLCDACNTSLGKLKLDFDPISKLKAIANYLGIKHA